MASFSLSERRGREGIGCFCFLDCLSGRFRSEGRREIGFLRAFEARSRFGVCVDPGVMDFLSSGLRTLFDNFIGRKRDVDGGVLAGFSCLREHGSPEETS